MSAEGPANHKGGGNEASVVNLKVPQTCRPRYAPPTFFIGG